MKALHIESLLSLAIIVGMFRNFRYYLLTIAKVTFSSLYLDTK